MPAEERSFPEAPLFEPCRHCGSEGYHYEGHPNDPHPLCIGVCPTCNGSGFEEIEDSDPLDIDDLEPLVPT